MEVATLLSESDYKESLDIEGIARPVAPRDWPFSHEIATGRPAPSTLPFGNRGSIYVFDYTITIDPLSRELKPCIFEIQTLNESVVSLARATNNHYNPHKANHKIKQRILAEIGVDEFTIDSHVSFNKARQRKILAASGCSDLQPEHIIIDGICDLPLISAKYQSLSKTRRERIAKFLQENPSLDLVLKRSNAARGEGNAFISKDELETCEDPAKLIVKKMSDICQDDEFSLEVGATPYKATSGHNVTFRAIVAIDDEGNAKGIKQWATLHNALNSHKKDDRYYLLEGIKTSTQDKSVAIEKHTRLEDFVEHHLARAASAMRTASKPALRASGPEDSARTIKVSERSLQQTELSEYVAILKDLFTETEPRFLPCFPDKVIKPPKLEYLEELAQGVALSGKAAANFVKDHLFNLLKDAMEKDRAEGNAKRLTAIAHKLNCINSHYIEPHKRKGYYKIKKLVAEMSTDYKGHGTSIVDAEAKKADIAIFMSSSISADDLANFITQRKSSAISSSDASSHFSPTGAGRLTEPLLASSRAKS